MVDAGRSLIMSRTAKSFAVARPFIAERHALVIRCAHVILSAILRYSIFLRGLKMKIGLRLMSALFVLSVAFGSAIVAQAQTRPPMVGGYKEAPTDDAEVKAAAEFAISQQAEKENITIKLHSIEQAERQVVAGMNYKLCLRIGKGDDPEDVDVKVMVFRSLKKEFVLKSWEEETCSKPEQDEDPSR
jgi:Cystatin domain